MVWFFRGSIGTPHVWCISIIDIIDESVPSMIWRRNLATKTHDIWHRCQFLCTTRVHWRISNTGRRPWRAWVAAWALAFLPGRSDRSTQKEPMFLPVSHGGRSGEVRDPCRSADADQLLYWTLFGGNPSVWTGRWAKCVQGCSCCAKMYCIYIYMYIYTFIIHIWYNSCII